MTPSVSARDAVARIRQGQRRAMAQAMTQVENQLVGATALLADLYPWTGAAWRIGITGPPGAGKSTLTDRLVAQLCTQENAVGVVAVDPSSPFTGGALLGDRIRFGEHPEVFLRSMATRGALGGLGRQTEAVTDIFDAAAYSVVLTETVGVGQGELDVAQAVDTVVVVLVPESGDVVQAMKAGLMEIADVFCVNKADHPEAGAMVRALRTMLHWRPESDWSIPIIQTSATRGEGISELLTAMSAHRDFLKNTEGWAEKRIQRFRRRVRNLVAEAWAAQFWTPARRALLDDTLATLDPHQTTPYTVAQQIMALNDPATK